MSPVWIVLFGAISVAGCILVFRMHAFLALLVGALLVASITSATQLEAFALGKHMPVTEAFDFGHSSVSARVSKEFGAACGRLGILIALASIVGKCMMESGSADKIVRSMTRVLGERLAPLAFLFSGYILSVPVFFDTVFLLMVPLCKAMWLRTRKHYVLYILAVIAGGSMNHSLVPPTPGPLFLATELKVNIGLMMALGCVVGSISASVGMLYAVWIDRRLQLPVRMAADAMPLTETRVESDAASLPPLWLALAPVVLPVVLIGGTTALDLNLSKERIANLGLASQNAIAILKWCGDPNIALALGAAIAMAAVAAMRRPVTDAVRKALSDGGQILLLIAAGSAFGGTLQQTGIGQQISDAVAGHRHFVLPIAFLVTVFVRAAQGSATVAMITSAGIFAGMALPEQLGFHPVYLALAIGCGSKPLSWMNDSGFWVIGKMSGLSESETLKTFSAQISIEGLAGMLVVWLLSGVMPLL